MTISIKSWIARFWPARAWRRTKRARLLNACLALGMATAWTPDAAATTLQLSVTPTETLNHAYVSYYTRNSSGQYVFSLGTLPGGQTTLFTHDFPSLPASEFDPSPPHTAYWHPAGYAVFGLYGSGASTGVALSFPDDSPIVQGATWDTLIKPINGRTEQDVIDGLTGVVGLSLEAFVNGLINVIKVPYGSQATLVNFSEATFGGTALAVVPEPATFALLVMGVGIIVLVDRRKAG
jgi:hypothetical protein